MEAALANSSGTSRSPEAGKRLIVRAIHKQYTVRWRRTGPRPRCGSETRRITWRVIVTMTGHEEDESERRPTHGESNGERTQSEEQRGVGPPRPCAPRHGGPSG